MKSKIFLLFLIIFFINQVSCLGVSPGIVNLNFSSNLETSFDMTIYNLPAKEQDVGIYIDLSKLHPKVAEELNNSFSLSKDSFSFQESDTTEKITVNVKLPSSLSYGGVHDVRIGALQKKQAEQQGTSIVAGNEIKVLITSPGEAFPEDLLLKNITAQKVSLGQKSNLKIELESQYLRAIFVHANIKVKKDDTTYLELNSSKIPISSFKQGAISEKISTTNLFVGEFDVDVEVFYEGKSKTGNTILEITEKKQGIIGGFKIGGREEENNWWWWVLLVIALLLLIAIIILLLLRRKKEIQIKSLYTQKQGDILNIETIIQNNTDEKIQINLTLDVLGKQTSSAYMTNSGENKIPNQINISGTSGEIEIKATVAYKDKSTEKKIKIQI